MTIRYICSECHAALKIRDEKAGQEGKCPGCGAAFAIPAPSRVVTSGADTDADNEDDDLVDMPLEITPDVDLPSEVSASDDFDPMNVLNTAPPPTKPSHQKNDERQPSVAELMRDHQTAKKKEATARARRQEKKVNALLVDVQPAGSAADAITRSYEKKRARAPEAPPMSREERRAAESRAAFRRATLQGAVGLAVVVVLTGGVYAWITGDGRTDLVDVTGRITIMNKTLANVRIQFAPVTEPGAPPPTEGTSLAPSYARTNQNGEFTLLFNAETRGAVVGNHLVTIDDPNGIPILSEGQRHLEKVTADDDNHFDINL